MKEERKEKSFIGGMKDELKEEKKGKVFHKTNERQTTVKEELKSPA
ncbi:hypothetical protein AB3Z07_21515 [Metabacillus halosaccharovorans]